MGLLDYYRQFEEQSEEEERQELARRASERKARELALSKPLDLSQTVWPELPHPSVVQALTHAARSALQRYPDPGPLREALAARHRLEQRQIAVGAGAAGLLAALARRLLGPGDEVLMAWPGYPLFPALARAAGAEPVPVAVAPAAVIDGGVATVATALLSRAGPKTKLVLLARPNDPTGELIAEPELAALVQGLPATAWLVLDEALVEFAGPGAAAVAPALLADNPRLVVVRSFSKGYGLAGLRVGYALGGEAAAGWLAELEPPLGVDGLALAGALEAVESLDGVVAGRAHQLAGERSWLSGELRGRGFAVADSAASFLWVSHPLLAANRLVGGLERRKVLVASGEPLGFPSHLRVAVHDRHSSTRFLEALDRTVEELETQGP